jgi:hypothetical protein
LAASLSGASIFSPGYSSAANQSSTQTMEPGRGGSGGKAQQTAGEVASAQKQDPARRTPHATIPAVAANAVADAAALEEADFAAAARARQADQIAQPGGGTVVLLSRVAYGDYARSSYAFHLGLRNDERRVSNEVNLIFGNVRRPGDKADDEEQPIGRHGAAGTDAGSRDGKPPQDEFRVFTRSVRNSILDLGAVDYDGIRAAPVEIHRAEHRAVVKMGHVYVIKIEERNRTPAEPFYVKLKVTRHRQNDAVEFIWEPLPETAAVTPDF